MTIGDLLDNVARASDDTSDEFRTAARRWLNLVRSHVAERARWRGAVRVDSFSTSSAITTGLYTLPRVEHLVEDTLYDETNNTPIHPESHALLNGIDVPKEVFGQPSFWGDAGSDDSGNRRIYLWPIPDGTYTIRFTGVGLLDDLVEDDDGLTVDPYFGRLVVWGDVFASGLRYHQLDDSNEDANQTLAQLRIFDKLIDGKKGSNRLAPVSSVQLQNIRQLIHRRTVGRFDPAHFENR